MSLNRAQRRFLQANAFGWDSRYGRAWWQRPGRRHKPRLTPRQLAWVEKRLEKELEKERSHG